MLGDVEAWADTAKLTANTKAPGRRGEARARRDCDGAGYSAMPEPGKRPAAAGANAGPALRPRASRRSGPDCCGRMNTSVDLLLADEQSSCSRRMIGHRLRESLDM